MTERTRGTVSLLMSAAPWEIDPPLKLPRLELLARLAVDTRNRALAEADRDAGDTNWGIGCKAHERFVHAVSRLAARGEHGWLRVHREGLSFTSIIDGISVRAYCGSADAPQQRHIQAAYHDRDRGDRRQLALPFASTGAVDDGWVWLMAVEIDDAGRAVRVVFFQANEYGETRSSYRISFEEEQAKLALDVPQERARSASRTATRRAVSTAERRQAR